MTRVRPKRPEPIYQKPDRACCDDQCCQELLLSAADGALCQTHDLEYALDHLERAK